MLLAAIREANVQLAAVNLLGNQAAARFGDPLEPDSDGDPVAVEITVLPNNNVTKVEPDAQSQGITLARKSTILEAAERAAAKGIHSGKEAGEGSLEG